MTCCRRNVCCRGPRGATGATGVGATGATGTSGGGFDVGFYADKTNPQTGLAPGNSLTIRFFPEVFDQDSSYNNDSTFTAPATGHYHFDAGLVINMNNGSGTVPNLFQGQVRFMRNGTTPFGNVSFIQVFQL